MLCLVASRVDAEWTKTELTERVASIHGTVDELSRAAINKLITTHSL